MRRKLQSPVKILNLKNVWRTPNADSIMKNFHRRSQGCARISTNTEMILTKLKSAKRQRQTTAFCSIFAISISTRLHHKNQMCAHIRKKQERPCTWFKLVKYFSNNRVKMCHIVNSILMRRHHKMLECVHTNQTKEISNHQQSYAKISLRNLNVKSR